MADTANEPDGITRREFATRVGAAAAGVAAGGGSLQLAAAGGAARRRTHPRRQRSRRHREHRHPRPGQLAEARLRQAQERRNQDALRHRREPGAGADQRRAARRTSPRSSRASSQDLRRVMDDKDIDAVVIATPNHWHALATIWALQAGKHVYVEKPSSHTVWEGRKMVEATARYNKIVQVGTMNRSRPAVRDAIKFIHEGGLGKIYMARGLCYKPRPAIGKYPDGPMAPGEKYALTTIVDVVRADLRPAVSVEGRLRPVARAGAEAPVQPQSLPLQLALALGLRQRRQRQPGAAPVRHRALGPAEAGAPGQDPIGRRLFRRRGVAGDAERADEHLRVRRRQDPRVRHARRVHERRRQREDRQPVLRLEGLAVDRGGRQDVAVVFRAEEREGPGRGASDGNDRRADRAHDDRVPALPELHRRDPRERSEGPDLRRPRRAPVVHAAAPRQHLVPGRAVTLQFDGKSEKFVNDKQADQLLTREYRKGFEIPNSFSTGTHDQANR